MTLAQVLRSTATQFPDRTAFVTLGKGAISWSYRELYDRVRCYAAVLQTLGLKRGDRIAISSENCPEWSVADWACHILGYIVVPIYPTLPPDQAEYIVRDSESTVVLCGGHEQHAKFECIHGVTLLHLTGPGSLDERSGSASFDPHAMDREIEAGDAEKPFTIIYTSGTTGTPKGAVIPHKAFVHVCTAARSHIQLSETDRFLCFLPMSHVYERVAGQCLPVYLGASVCFSKNLAALGAEMATFKPTIMLCVPRFLENLKDRIENAFAKEKPFKRKLIAMALEQGRRRAHGKSAPLFPVLDRLVCAKVRARAGGQLRYFVSGGAALPPAVAEFYMAIGLEALQGYGLTETSGGTFVNRPENNKYWTVGESLNMECKIAPDGEILIRGPALMREYYHLPEETAEAIDSDGWFHTGDIGEFEGSNLKITDRKKDILVLANGKNVAPQKVENALKTSPYIQEAVVMGNGMDHCVALIVPNFELVQKVLGLGNETALASNEAVRSLIRREVDAVNKGLAPYEMVKKQALLNDPFSIETGELTPSLKVKRKVVESKFADVIARLR
jgi:long-chain acyl-CoA synthetase